jgi:hypothetical protein
MATGRVATSIDNMSPSHRFIRVLSGIPLSPGVTAHSIISVDDDGPLADASDGVVKYKSAHIDGVESELVVHSPHSGMQAAPPTIEEMRRILLEHSARSACPVPRVGRNSVTAPKQNAPEDGPALDRPVLPIAEPKRPE